MTSWRHVMTSQNLIYHLPISACRCPRKLILFLFPWFVESLSSKMLLIFYLFDVVTSRRHVMTSQNLMYLSQLVYVLEKWFFFVSMVFLGHWVWKCYWFLFVQCCDVMTSCRDVTKPDLPVTQLRDVLESWFFFVSMDFWATEVQNCQRFFICMMSSYHDVMSWRHKICYIYLILWTS